MHGAGSGSPQGTYAQEPTHHFIYFSSYYIYLFIYVHAHARVCTHAVVV